MNMDIATVNTLPYEDFVNIFGNVVEKCPIITAAVWSRRPFVNFAALEAAISEFIDALPESGSVKLLYFVFQLSKIWVAVYSLNMIHLRNTVLLHY